MISLQNTTLTQPRFLVGILSDHRFMYVSSLLCFFFIFMISRLLCLSILLFGFLSITQCIFLIVQLFTPLKVCIAVKTVFFKHPLFLHV